MVRFSSCPCHIRLGSGACALLWSPELQLITIPALPEDLTNKLASHPAQKARVLALSQGGHPRFGGAEA